MTVAAQASYSLYTGNGVTTVFPYGFKILAGADLTVYVAGDLQTLNVNYSVSGVGDAGGGSITFLTGAPTLGLAVSIIRVMVASRSTDYQFQGDFNTSTVNPDFDRPIMLIQDVHTQLTRTFRLPADEVGALPELPALVDRAGKYVFFDVLGNLVPSNGTGTDNTLRTELASSVVGVEGARLIGIRRAEVAASVRSVADKLRETVSPLDFGAVGDGVADDGAAIQAACTALATTGGTVRFPSKYTFRSTININVPVGDGNTVDLLGCGHAAGGVLFDGVAVTTGFTFTGAGYSYAGSIHELRIRGVNGAVRPFTYTDCNHPLVHRCRLASFIGSAGAFLGCIMSMLSHTLITGCGSATEGSFEVDNFGAVESTTFMWDHSRISGKSASSAVGGLIINRTFDVTIIGGAAESCGIPIRVGNKVEAARGCTVGLIAGIDLENPGNGNPYMEFGAGISTVFIQCWKFAAINASPGASTPVPFFVSLTRCSGFDFDIGNYALVTGTAMFNLLGAANLGITIRAHRNLYDGSGGAAKWVFRGGVQVKAAGPYTDWNSDDVPRGLVPIANVGMPTGTTPSVLIAPQGGYNGVAVFNNAGPTTVTQVLDGENGMQVRWGATNSNTTLTHGTGAGQIDLIAGGNYVVPSGHFIDAIHNGTCWKEIRKSELTGSAAGTDPANLVDGAGVSINVTVAGATLGQFAQASFSLDLQGITLTAWVSAANTVSCRFQNETGGAIDLASGTLRARVTS